MSNWNAEHYLKFGDERTRAAVDLAARVRLPSPDTIVDLGCGPGNSSEVLRRRWPKADFVGVDSSPEMIAAARQRFPDLEWQLADLAEWSPPQSYDLVFSNAALQWVPDHGPLMRRLIRETAMGGALAFQIPSGTFAEVRNLIHEISHDPKWNDRMSSARSALTMEDPSFYYDALAQDSTDLDIWESEYHHVMESTDAVVDWIASTGLRPFWAALRDETEREEFVNELKGRVALSYEVRADGRVLFPFRRTFVIAYR
jgi:trans-aconitate 2-methyltransferase